MAKQKRVKSKGRVKKEYCPIITKVMARVHRMTEEGVVRGEYRDPPISHRHVHRPVPEPEELQSSHTSNRRR